MSFNVNLIEMKNINNIDIITTALRFWQINMLQSIDISDYDVINTLRHSDEMLVTTKTTVECVSYLLNKLTGVDYSTIEGFSGLLWCATYHGNISVFKYIEELYGNKFPSKTKVIAKAPSIEMCELLYKHGDIFKLHYQLSNIELVRHSIKSEQLIGVLDNLADEIEDLNECGYYSPYQIPHEAYHAIFEYLIAKSLIKLYIDILTRWALLLDVDCIKLLHFNIKWGVCRSRAI